MRSIYVFKMNKKTIVFVVAYITFSLGFAQQKMDSTKIEKLNEVVITDSKFNLKRENSGKVITKITQKDLQKLKGKSIAEIINSTAGIEINGAKSNAGQNLSYYIRGGRNRQVLVLIDGIAVTDPSQIANDYDLRLLNTEQIESIEILKGASSTLYGSGAATAVINIKLKQPSTETVAMNISSSFGTNNNQDDKNNAIHDFRNSVLIQGTFNSLNYLASFNNQFTDGLSAIRGGTEQDSYNSINGNIKLGYNVSNKFKLNTFLNFDKFKSNFDNGFLGIDSDDKAITEQFRIGLSPEFTFKKGSLNFNGAYNKVNRDIISSYPAKFYSNSFIGDLYSRYNFNNKIYTVLGLNVQYNSMESFVIPFGSSALEQSINPNDAKFKIIDPYFNVVYVSDFGLNINAGARFNNHSEYGSHMVYSFNPSYRKDFNFGYVKGLVSYSTAYITPSLYQLFEPTYGNINLMPEENATFETGIELQIEDKSIFTMVYFNRKEKNFIDFKDLGSFNYQYKNIENSFTASGFEFTMQYKFSNRLNTNANITYTHVNKDLSLRIPEFKANLRLDYQLASASFISLAYQFNDDRTDLVYNNSTFENEEVLLKKYSLFDLFISHKICNQKVTLFASITNVFNENYQELFNYTTKGRNINIGFDIKL